MTRVHESIKWGLISAIVEGRFLSNRQVSHLEILNAMNEAVLRLSVNILVEQIELDLKRMLYVHLRRIHLDQWWSQLPKPVRQSAKSHYLWSSAALGARRVVRFPDVCWLTFGDILKSLNTLSLSEWQACLRAETRRRQPFMNTVKGIKAFRDYHIAHPKPRKLTTSEITSLCRTTRRLAVSLRPVEWLYACNVVRNERSFYLPADLLDSTILKNLGSVYCQNLLKWVDTNFGNWSK
jgi:predicted phosphatase